LETDLYLLLLFLAFVMLAPLSALFAGIHTAFLSLSEVEQRQLSEASKKSAARVRALLRNKRSFLTASKAASLITNVLVIFVLLQATQELALRNQLSFAYAVLIGVGLSVFVLFFIEEIWANLIVLRNNQWFALRFAAPAAFFFTLVKPFAKLAANIFFKIAGGLTVVKRRDLIYRQKIMAAIAEEGDELTELKDSERAMIHSIFEFGDTEVYEVMVPRTDMICVEEKTTLDQLVQIINEHQHSRLPLYHGEVDQILGIIYVKDLLNVIKEPPVNLDLKKLARDAYFVPENKKLHNLLRDFQQTKHHMAIVVDEYGGTSGLVTLEDVIEQIVGDIQDEYDEELPLYRKLDEQTFLIDGKIDLHDLNEKLHFDLPTEGDFETLGGFILSLTGHLPKNREVVKYNGYTFTVEKIEHNRILRVKLTKETPPTDAEMDANET
jgi:CBS domain containing-hemolysin-like protein